MTTIKGYFHNVAEGKREMPTLWRQICGLMRNTLQGVAVVAYIPQSRDQQKIYHSALNDLARQVDLSGVRRDAEVWKRYTLAAFYAGCREVPEFAAEWDALAPLLLDDPDGDGMHLVVVKSTMFSKGLASAYLTYLHSIGDQHGVRWSPTSLGREAANDASTAQREAA